jgi:hypothetical protein
MRICAGECVRKKYKDWDGQYKVALITYDESKQSEADAIVEWEAENGPVVDYQTIFITSYEALTVG